MKRLNKFISALLVLTLTFAIVIPPSEVLAAPLIPPIAPTLPSVKPIKSYKLREAPSAINGVNYKFDPKVINLPAQPYTLEDIPQPEENSGGQTGIGKPTAPTIGPIRPGLGSTPPAPGAALPQAPVPVQGKELPINAKNLVINKGVLNPKVGDIYFDPVTNDAFKVVGDTSTDDLGKMIVPVVKPGVDEVLQQFNVPNQTISLTEGNIDFSSMAEGVEYVGMENKSTSMASSAGMKGIEPPVQKQGNTYIFRLKNFTIFEYPNPDDQEEMKKAAAEEKKAKEEAAKKAKEAGTYDYLKNYEWTGAENESSVGVKIKISDGVVKVTDPKINFDAGWDTLLSPYGKAHCDIDMKIDSNVTIEGNIKFKEERWQQIYGYLVCDNQSDPTVRIYIGIFAVVSLEGELSFKVKVQQVGQLNHGIDMYFSSLIAPGVPLGIIPTGSFDPQEQSVGIIIDGHIKAQAGVMAGLGIEILDFKVLQLQLKLGLEGDCTFHIEMGDTGDMGGGGNAPPGGASASATFSLSFFVELNAFIAGVGTSLFDVRLKLLEKTWSGSIGGDDSAGAGSEGVSKIPCRTDIYIDKVDAAEEMVEGHVLIGDMPNQRPYQGPVRVHVLLYDWLGNSQGTRTFNLTTDANGKFYIRTAISPFDYVAAQVFNETDIEIYKAATKAIKATVPYSIIDFEPDAFNDLVYGNVSGQYSGPLSILVNSPGKSTRVHQINAVLGDFELSVPLTGGDTVNVLLGFENMDIFAQTNFKPANIDSLKVNIAPCAEPAATGSEEVKGVTMGSIQNTNGETPYTGQVKLEVNRLIGLASDPQRITLFSGSQAASAFGAISSQAVAPGAADILGSLPQGPELPASVGNVFGSGARPMDFIKAISSFHFNDTPIPTLKREYIVEIEHEGIRKIEKVSYETEQDYTSHVESHGFEEAAASPLNDIINIRVNPTDIVGYGMRGIEVMNVPQDVLMQGLNQNVSGQQQGAMMPSNMPSQPFSLNAVAGDNSVNLEWRPFIGNDVSGYNLYRGTSSGNYGADPIKSLSKDDTKYTDRDVKNGTTYYYTIKAVFSDKTESQPANEATAKPTASVMPIKPPAIKIPIKP
ncbi:MAG: fibronectin type III domain-containing protein [Lutispora sp.]|nr:fibronectin type III domain-containing protein [Lutispora sp.]